MRGIVIFLSYNFFLPSQTAYAKERICTQQEAMEAEVESSSLEDWAAVYRAFVQFGHCDDAAISEGYSSTVARLLTRDWQKFETLHRLTVRNRGFETFIVRHIDQLWSMDEAKAAANNARAHCPKNARRLCHRILNAINDQRDDVIR